MIFGGLEIVAGGYLIHRHYRKKNEQGRLQQEVEQRRYHTFPGVECSSKHSGWNTKAQHRPHPHLYPSQQSYQQVNASPTKYTLCAPAPAETLHAESVATQPARPPQPTHSSSFTIPRRPVPDRKPQVIIPTTSLQRADSFATLSRMPIADGRRPHDAEEDTCPIAPQRHSTGLGLSPYPQHAVYGNVGFSVSTPAFGATATSPPLTYSEVGGNDLVTDGNWDVYGRSERVSYAPTVSTQLGEQEPPPPYTPR